MYKAFTNLVTVVVLSLFMPNIGLAQNLGTLRYSGASPSSVTPPPPAGNAKSPIGINLTGIASYSSEQPFVNLLKSGTGWVTGVNGGTFDTNEEAALCMDSNGYVTDLAHKLSAGVGSPCTTASTFNIVRIALNTGLTTPFYPAGTYDILDNGGCTYQVSSDASGLTTIGSGHHQFTVSSPSGSGIELDVTAISGTCNNISVTLSTQTAAWQTGCVSGLGVGCFQPTFCCSAGSFLAAFRALRFMDWMFSNGDGNGNPNPQVNYTDRPIATLSMYGAVNGVPMAAGVAVEVMVGLCNAGTFDCWFNMPISATSSYVSSFASYVHSNLNSPLKAYVEYSNETWNGGFPQYQVIVNDGKAVYGSTCGGGGDFECNRNWHGFRSATNCQTWKTAWGSDSARVVCVLGAQADSSTFTATESLSCPLAVTAGQITTSCASGYGLTAVAIAPYFTQDAGDTGSPCYPTSFLSGTTAQAVTNLFTAINTGGNMSGGNCEPTSPTTNASLLAQSSSYETTYTALVGSSGILEIVEYEWGQQFAASNYAAWVTPMTNANTDARMGTAYTSRMTTMKANNIHLSMHFSDISVYSQFGFWGLCQNLFDVSCGTEVKNAAVNTFITNNNCWWAGC